MKYRITNESNDTLSFFDGTKIVTLKPKESTVTREYPRNEGRFKIEPIRKESPKKEKKTKEGEK